MFMSPVFSLALSALELPGAEAAALDRRVHACDRLTWAASEHKVRIKDLVRQLMPMTPLTGDLGKADLAVLERYADPRALLAAGPAELIGLITSASGHQQGKERALQRRAAATAAIDLYADHPAVPFAELAAEVATEVRLLRAIQAELAAHTAAREQHYRQVDPGQLARSLPGFAEISAPVQVAIMGRPGRFRDATRFKTYAGLAPRASGVSGPAPGAAHRGPADTRPGRWFRGSPSSWDRPGTRPATGARSAAVTTTGPARNRPGQPAAAPRRPGQSALLKAGGWLSRVLGSDSLACHLF